MLASRHFENCAGSFRFFLSKANFSFFMHWIRAYYKSIKKGYIDECAIVPSDKWMLFFFENWMEKGIWKLFKFLVFNPGFFKVAKAFVAFKNDLKKIIVPFWLGKEECLNTY